MEYNSDFKWDLKVGQLHEEWLGDLLQSKTIEVKRDFMASRTGRVFVEFFCRNKPSGIATTQAKFWAFILDDETVVLLPVKKLLALAFEAEEKGNVVYGGDNNLSVGALIELERLVK